SGKTRANEDKSALQKQVDDLLATIAADKQASDARIAELASAREGDRVSYEMRGMYGNLKTVFDELPAPARTAAIDALIAKELSTREASFGFEETGTFVLKGKEDAAVIAANNTR